MAVLKRRSVAILIAVILVIVSTSTGVKISLESASRDIEELFYSGVEYDGYLHPSIYSQLEKRSDAANGLLTIGRKYELTAECDDLEQAREFLGYSSSPSSYYYNNEDLQKAFDVLKNELNNCELTERDAKLVEEYSSIFENATGVIDDSGYNEAVRAFYRDVIYQFPAEWFYYNMYIDTPSYFGTMWY